MEIEDLKCMICNELFNELNRIPRLLISCGHTYCQECLNSLHSRGDLKSIVCPEDKTCYTFNKIEELPKNITLMKLISRKKIVSFRTNIITTNSLYNLFNNRLQTPPNILSNQAGSNFNSDCGDVSRNFLTAKLEDKYETIRRKSLRKSYSVNNYDDGSNSPNESTRNLEICPSHGRPLEVVCVDHKVKICTNCALFGDHKSHDIRNVEDVFLELCTKAEILLETFEIIDFSMENYEKRDQLDKIDFIYTEKYNLLLSKVEIFYKDFKKLIKSKRDRMIELIKEKFDSIQKNITCYKKFPPDLEEKIINWRKIVKGKLDVIAEINDTNEIDYELLGKKADEQQIDLISESEEFIKKIEILKAAKTDDLERLIDNYDVEWNKANIEHENFCQLIDKNCENPSNAFDFTDKLTGNENLLNFHEQTDFDPRISVIPFSTNNQSINIKINTGLKHTPVRKKSGRRFTETNTTVDKSGWKKNHAVVNLYNKENSQESISTKANETINCKLDDSFYLKGANSTVLNLSQDNLYKNKNKTNQTKGTVTNDKIVFIKNQFKNEIASFNCYDIGDEAAKVVAELISNKNCKVKDLKLTKTNIADEGSIQIFKALESNISIVNFNISKNLISDKSLESIVNCMKINKSIKVLNLSLNLFSSSTKDKLKYTPKNSIKLIL